MVKIQIAFVLTTGQQMVHIRVRIFSQAMPDQTEMELHDGSSVEMLLLQIKEKVSQENPEVRDSKIAFLDNTGSLIVLLNGMSIYSLSGWKTVLHEADEVSFLPMVAGG